MNKQLRRMELDKMMEKGDLPRFGTAKTWEVAHIMRKDERTVRQMTRDGRLVNRARPAEHMEITWASIRGYYGM